MFLQSQAYELSPESVGDHVAETEIENLDILDNDSKGGENVKSNDIVKEMNNDEPTTHSSKFDRRIIIDKYNNTFDPSSLVYIKQR